MKSFNLNINHQNVCYLIGKMDDIKVQIQTPTKIIHILCISETHLEEKMDDKSIELPQYTFIRRDKQRTLHTGLVVYIHNSVCKGIKRRHDLESDCIECIWLELKQNKSTPLLIGFIYRNPNETFRPWLVRYEVMIDKVLNTGNETIIQGDFNIDLHKPQTTWNSFNLSFGLTQLINDTTRVTSGTLIDHIYTNTKDKITNVSVIKTSMSDHYMISCSYATQVKLENKKGHTTIQYRCYKKCINTLFLADINNLPLGNVYHTTDPEIALKTLMQLITPIIDKHIPLKSRRVKEPNLPAWINTDIINAMELRTFFNNNNMKTEYKQQRNKVTQMVKNARKGRINNMINDKKDTRSIWRAYNEFSNIKSNQKSQPIKICPDIINDFFLNLSETILTKRNIESSKKYQCPATLKEYCKAKTNDTNFELPYLSIQEVGKLIANLKDSNALGPDNISVKIIKLISPYIVEYMTYIYNLCIEKNVFPYQLKEAKVIPLPKTKDPCHPQFLRPISLLPALSKPFERYVHKHMYNYLNSHQLLHQYQSGFRPFHSCHTALVRLTDNWLQAIGKKELIGTVFLDFKKAFDLVNHRTLLLKLQEYFSNAPQLQLLKSYLSDRFQYVLVNGKTSVKKKTKSGVPQGSVLGPLLFLIYINDLPLHLHIHPLHPNSKTSNELFADDSSIYTLHKDINIINNNLQLSLNLAEDWCNDNSMVIHPDKTTSMLIATRQKQQLTDLKLTLFIGNKAIEQVKNHKMLGIHIDSKLTWQTHLQHLTKRLSKNVYLLAKLRKIIDAEHLKLFYDAHIMSHLNYASTIWDGCSQDTFNSINRQHRRAIKLISTINNTTTENKMQNLNILPLSVHLQYNKATLMHKIYHDKAPYYLNQLLKKTTLRYGSMNLVPPLPRIDIEKTSLAYSGSVVWNDLPDHFKINMSTKSFKLKVYKYFIALHNQKD